MKNTTIATTVIVSSFLAFAVWQRISAAPAVVPVTIPIAVTVTPSTGVTTTLQPTNTKQVNPTSKPTTSVYKNGTFDGDSTDAFYGNVQVRVAINNDKITNVTFLDHPQDRGRSVEINNYAMPLLTSEAIQSQKANVDVVSGATATSQAFVQSLQSALDKAKI